MSQEQYIMAEKESQNLQKRNQQLQDQYARLDIACNHASEELATAHSQIERLRNDCSNLRAEKKIWENVQTRLLDENKLLSLERSRMADLIANVQKLHNDIDKTNESDRRRQGRGVARCVFHLRHMIRREFWEYHCRLWPMMQGIWRRRLVDG